MKTKLLLAGLMGFAAIGCGEEPKSYEPVTPVEKPKGDPVSGDTKGKNELPPPPPPPPPPG